MLGSTVTTFALLLSSLTGVQAAVSTTGRCGKSYSGLTCGDSSFGNCCSSASWCGSSTGHCGTGCQSAYGTCGSSASSVPVASKPVSTNARCGSQFGGQTCQGSSWGNCCSNWGYCGSTGGYCAAEICQKEYGSCNAAPSSAIPSTLQSIVKSQIGSLLSQASPPSQGSSSGQSPVVSSTCSPITVTQPASAASTVTVTQSASAVTITQAASAASIVTVTASAPSASVVTVTASASASIVTVTASALSASVVTITQSASAVTITASGYCATLTLPCSATSSSASSSALSSISSVSSSLSGSSALASSSSLITPSSTDTTRSSSTALSSSSSQTSSSTAVLSSFPSTETASSIFMTPSPTNVGLSSSSAAVSSSAIPSSSSAAPVLISYINNGGFETGIGVNVTTNGIPNWNNPQRVPGSYIQRMAIQTEMVRSGTGAFAMTPVPAYPNALMYDQTYMTVLANPRPVLNPSSKYTFTAWTQQSATDRCTATWVCGIVPTDPSSLNMRTVTPSVDSWTQTSFDCFPPAIGATLVQFTTTCMANSPWVNMYVDDVTLTLKT